MRKSRSRTTVYSKHQGTKAGKQPRATQKATSSKAWGQSSSTNSLQSSSTRPRHGSRSGAPQKLRQDLEEGANRLEGDDDLINGDDDVMTV